MSYPDNVVQQIDVAIAGLLPVGCQVIGIADLVTRKESDKKDRIWPAGKNEFGDYVYAGVDDSYPAVTYHRSLSITGSRLSKGGYGDALPDQKLVHNMCLVVYVNALATKERADQVALNLLMNFPQNLSGEKKPEGFKSTVLNIGNIVLINTQVFGEEYRNVDPFLTPEQILFKVNYTIESTYTQACSNTCP